MSIYITFLILSILICFLKPKWNRLIGIPLMLAAGYYCAFRASSVGSDTLSYLVVYKTPSILANYSSEYIFYFIINSLRKIGYTPTDCQKILALITFVPLIILFYKKSVNFGISFLILYISSIGYYLETFNIVRQMASLPFIMFAYIFLQESRYKWSLLFCLIAIGFHTSNILFVPVMFLSYKFKVSYKIVIIGITSTLIFAFFISSISFVKNLAISLEQLGMLSKYSHFANYKMELARNFNGLLTLIFPPSILCLVSYNLLIKEGREIIARLFFYGCCILNIISIFPTSYRMGMNIICLELLIYPILFSKKGIYRIYAIGAICLLIIFYLWALPVHRDLIPYKML